MSTRKPPGGDTKARSCSLKIPDLSSDGYSGASNKNIHKFFVAVYFSIAGCWWCWQRWPRRRRLTVMMLLMLTWWWMMSLMIFVKHASRSVDQVSDELRPFKWALWVGSLKRMKGWLTGWAIKTVTCLRMSEDDVLHAYAMLHAFVISYLSMVSSTRNLGEFYIYYVQRNVAQFLYMHHNSSRIKGDNKQASKQTNNQTA